MPSDRYSIWQEFYKKNGHQLFYFPAYQITANHLDYDLLISGLNQLTTSSWVIFTSRHAVPYLPSSWLQIIRDNSIPIACIGPSTFQACTEAGMNVYLTMPYGSTSESLLKHEYFTPQSIEKNEIIIASGLGGRDFLESELILRGAFVTKYALYKRKRTQDKLYYNKIMTWGINALTVTSLESWQHIRERAEPKAIHFLKKQKVFTLSQRISKALSDEGFRDIKIIEPI